MKPVRQKKVLGIVLGERSLLAAEVIASTDRPQVQKLAEMIYPEAISVLQPTELSRAIGHFLKDNHFSTRSAVIGIPLKWLVVKTKQVPPADDETLAQLLRLEAEAEFSTELKDLVYDFADASTAGGASRTILLTATPRKYIDAIEHLCEGARLGLLAITPSALALGSVTGSSIKEDVLVLSVGSIGSELSSQKQSSATAIQNLRSSATQPPFISELRRAVSTLPVSDGPRQMVLWDGAGLDAGNLGQQIGVNIRPGELGALGVDSSVAGINGQGAKYAGAVALALSAMGETGPSIDFAHSRLAPPRQHRIPRWAYLAAAVVVAIIFLAISAYNDLSSQQQMVDDKNAQIAKEKDQADSAREFVNKVTIAEYWRSSDPRYMECLRDLYPVIPEDNQTYATSLDIKAQTPSLAIAADQSTAAAVPNPDAMRLLGVTLQGHSANLENVTAIADRMNHKPDVFKDVKIGSSAKMARTNEYLFTITFGYLPPKPSAPAAPTPTK